MLLILAGVRPAQAQEGLGIRIEVTPVDVFRVSDFDALRPREAPIVYQVTVEHLDPQRSYARVVARLELFDETDALLASGFYTVGEVGPGRPGPFTFTNRDIELDENGLNENIRQEFIDYAYDRGVFPPGTFVFRVKLEADGTIVSEDEGFVTTTNPGDQLDLNVPGVPFGQEAEPSFNPFPLFQWFAEARTYDFAVYEVLPGQTSADEVTAGRPIYQRQGLTETTLVYPTSAEALEPGRRYAWRVEAIILTAFGEERRTSEVYWFEIAAPPGTEEETSTPTAPPPVVRIELLPDEMTVRPGGLVPFQAMLFDADDLPVVNQQPTWRVRPPTAGTISAEGLFTAGTTPGPAAIIAEIEDVRQFATVFIEAPEVGDVGDGLRNEAAPGQVPGITPPGGLPALAAPDLLDPDLNPDPDRFRDSLLTRGEDLIPDAAAPVAPADTAGVEITVVSPGDGQEFAVPTPNLAWQIAGPDARRHRRFRLTLWAVPEAHPAEAVPGEPPIWQQEVTGRSLLYPAGAPPLEDGRFYMLRAEVLDAEGAALAQSTPVRFSLVRPQNITRELYEAWSQGAGDGTLTLLAELRSPPLGALDRQQLQNAGIQVEIEDGPWVQLAVPFAQISTLAGFGFIRYVTLPAPPVLHGEAALAATEAAVPPVPMAVLEFGFDEARVRDVLADRTHTFHSFRMDQQISGGSARLAQHGLATVQALVDYLPPETPLHLMNFATPLEFRKALEYAVDTLGVKVVSCSVAWMDAYDHYDGTSYFSQRLAEILGDKAVMVVASGNFALGHWEATFTDTDGDGAHDFASDAPGLAIEVRRNTPYQVLLSWDDWAGDAPQQDLDLEIVDAEGRVIRSPARQPYRSDNRQGAGQYERPVERIRNFQSLLPGRQTVYVRVVRHRLAGPPPHFELYIDPAPQAATPPAEPASSLAAGMATTRSQAVFPVSASGYARSSQGPTNDARLRPDFATTGTVEVGGQELEGTSFATPRVAAAFALVFARHPDWSIDQAARFLRLHSLLPDGGTDKDPRYGWGIVDFEGLRAALGL